jgi:hypothetical protein
MPNIFNLTDQVVDEFVSIYPRSIRGALRGVLQGNEVKVSSGNTKSIANALNEIGATVASDPSTGVGLAEASATLIETAGALIISAKVGEIVESLKQILGGGDAKTGQDIADGVAGQISGGPAGQSPELAMDFLNAIFGRAARDSERKEEKTRRRGRNNTIPPSNADRRAQFGRDVATEPERTGRSSRYERMRDALRSNTAALAAAATAAAAASAASIVDNTLPGGTARPTPSFNRTGHQTGINTPGSTVVPPGTPINSPYPTPMPSNNARPVIPDEKKKIPVPVPAIPANTNKFKTRTVKLKNPQWRPMAKVIDLENFEAESVMQSKADFANFNFYNNSRSKNKNNQKDNPLYAHAISELTSRFSNTFGGEAIKFDRFGLNKGKSVTGRLETDTFGFLPNVMAKPRETPTLHTTVDEPSYLFNTNSGFRNYTDRDRVFNFEAGM